MCLLFLDLLISFYIVIIYKNLRLCVDIYIYIFTHTHTYVCTELVFCSWKQFN